MKQRFKAFVLLIFFSIPAVSNIQAGTLKNSIDSIITGKHMTVGVSAECGKQKFTLNGTMHFPMMSVFKVHVTLAVLNKLDRQNTSPDTILHIRREKIRENTYSPMRGDYPTGDIDISISRLIDYAIAESDNNACDILIDFAGGVKTIDSYIRKLGIRDFKIIKTEASMHENTSHVYNNWSTPKAITELLKTIESGRNMPRNVGVLMSAMSKAKTGLDKIAAGVPDGAIFLHKTGSSDRINGIKTADNDAAIIRFPSTGRTVFLTVLIKESSETDTVNAAVIAAITRAIMTEFISK